MKKTAFLIWSLALVCSAGIVFGQGGAAIKVGHTNSGNIITQLPEVKKAQSELETMKTQLEKVIQEKSKGFEEKVERYQSTAESMSQQARESMEADLQKQQAELQELQSKSEQTFREKQEAIFKPIMEMVNKAIGEVGKENGYQYIINSDTGSVGNPVILYAGSEETDITKLVLKKLGVTASN